MYKQNKIWDVVIIGGGASGMMASSVASSLGKSVLLLEKNKNLGEKLKITGGGRCNITNAEPDIHKFLEIYGKGKDFLYTPFSIFGVKDTFTYFESRGLPLVIEARYRVFPESQKALDVFNILNKEILDNKVFIKTNCRVLGFEKEKGEIKYVKTNQGDFYAKSFILSTGGLSHPETGSTGDGLVFLKNLGHKVTEPSPDVVPLAVPDSWVHSLAGVSLSFMKITFYLDEKKQFSKTGKILFTHFGLSGPLILNSAKKVKELLHSGEVKAFIDLYPDTDIKSIEMNLIKVFNNNKNKTFKNIFKEIVPDGIAKGIIELFNFVDLNKKVHSITKEERKQISKLIKGLPIYISGTMGYDRAVVADGGVDMKEIDMKTMRSKIINNLYVTGDLLDMNRNSGGYSLQICWTTGYIAGKFC
ncbi:TPA: aminoacetone oxidase family FAD-binding enzyme [Candidatus Nomurabacteria bacterium]|nr:MAG: Flavoprotein family protein [Parcubacteria bacterium RAAC4_OD1_1]HCY26401.1 aminoacetone oxidase family FAD-binding enzyme [Candidatus Nomurabacteria bacterium]